MSFEIQCQHCGVELSVGDNRIGVPLDCPECGNEIVIEPEEKMEPSRRSPRQERRRTSANTVKAAGCGNKKPRPVLIACGVVSLIVLINLVIAVGLVAAVLTKSASLRNYARKQIEAEKSVAADERESALVLAANYHAAAPTLTEQDGSMGAFLYKKYFQSSQ